MKFNSKPWFEKSQLCKPELRPQYTRNEWKIVKLKTDTQLSKLLNYKAIAYNQMQWNPYGNYQIAVGAMKWNCQKASSSKFIDFYQSEQSWSSENLLYFANRKFLLRHYQHCCCRNNFLNSYFSFIKIQHYLLRSLRKCFFFLQ